MTNEVSATPDAWAIAHAAARAIGSFDAEVPGGFALAANGGLQRIVPKGAPAVLSWSPASGWESTLAQDDPNRDLLELYLPISSATAARPITIGHLGQSLDGFIATHSGDAICVTGPDNILHLHRLRALCDAVVVGAATVAVDNPRLTTRLVTGSNPVRVILDPGCRLPLDHTVFNDQAARTLRACAAGSAAADAARARGEDTLEVASHEGALDLKDLLRQLHALGCSRIFVEGGGVTVSNFLNAGLLDRLHIAVAPLLIGDGRPAIRLPPQMRLQDCLRLQPRVYSTGSDILFDCDLRAVADGHPNGHDISSATMIRRVL
ncbi:MAG TPA: RibD family protein [Steroidobacteraceae bacterium]